MRYAGGTIGKMARYFVEGIRATVCERAPYALLEVLEEVIRPSETADHSREHAA